MTDSNYTGVLLIIDRSGSMAGIAREMEGTIATFVKEQAEVPGKITFDYVRFDDKFEYVTKFARPDEFAVAIEPRGMTALYDAVVKASSQYGAALAGLPKDQRPDKVLVVVATDGFENASECNAAAVKEVLDRQQNKYSWEYIFLGANQDAVLTGTNLGFKADNSMTWNANDVAVASAGASLSSYTTTYRSGGSAAFSDEDRKGATQNA